MSENWDNKGYDEYFKKLEENLTRDRVSQTGSTETTQPLPKKKQQKGFYKVIKIKKSALIALSLIAIIIITVIALPNGKPKEDNIPETKSSDTTTVTEKKEEGIVKQTFKTDKNAVAIPDANDAQYAIIIDRTKGTVIAQRNAHERAYPASTTKVMTLLTAVELIEDFSDTFTMTYAITDPLYVAEASVAGFLNNEEVNMTDLLYGLILPSGADAAMGLAMKLGGSEEGFVAKMNENVKKLGLTDTHFDNVSGLHSKDNYTTAYDMAIILDAAMKNELCREILSTYQHTTTATPQNPDGILLSSTLFSHMYGTEPETATILGGKTGFVNESGYCIASFGENNVTKNEYIVVTFSNSSLWPAFYGQIDLYKEFAE